MNGLNGITFPAIEIKREFEEMAYSGGKCWEVRRRPLPLCKPVALVVDGRLSSFAEFDFGVVAPPLNLDLAVRRASPHPYAAKTGVSRGWLLDYSRGRDLYAFAYRRIARAPSVCGVHALFEGRIVTVTSGDRGLILDWCGRVAQALVFGEDPVKNAIMRGGAR